MAHDPAACETCMQILLQQDTNPSNVHEEVCGNKRPVQRRI